MGRAPSRRRKCREETSTPPTTTIDDRSAASYDRTATLDRIAQKFSLSRGSAALKPQVLAPPGLVAPFDAMLLALIEDRIRSDASANLCKTVADSFRWPVAPILSRTGVAIHSKSARAVTWRTWFRSKARVQFLGASSRPTRR